MNIPSYEEMRTSEPDPEWEAHMDQMLTDLGFKDDSVAESDACPKCGERDVDRLVWLDDDWVSCESCGMMYIPGEATFALTLDVSE